MTVQDLINLGFEVRNGHSVGEKTEYQFPATDHSYIVTLKTRPAIKAVYGRMLDGGSILSSREMEPFVEVLWENTNFDYYEWIAGYGETEEKAWQKALEMWAEFSEEERFECLN